MATVLFAYFDWQLAHLNLEAAKKQLEENEALVRTIEGRVRRGIAHAVDLDRVQLEVLDSRETILALETEVRTRADEIGRIMGREDVYETLQPQLDLQLYDPEADLDAMRASVLEQSRTLQAFALSEEAGVLTVTLRDQDLDPAVSFLAGISVDNSTRFTTQTDRAEIFAGFTVQWPLWDEPSRARLQRAKYERRTIRVARAAFLHNLEHSTRSYLALLRTQAQRTALSEQRIEVTERIVERESVRHGRSQVSLETLVNARKGASVASFEHLSNQAELNKAVIEWLRLTDRLVVDGATRLP